MGHSGGIALKVDIRGDLVGILSHLSEKLGMSMEDIILQTIYCEHPRLFERLVGVDSLNLFVQLDAQRYEWMEALQKSYQIPNRETLVRAVLGLD